MNQWQPDILRRIGDVPGVLACGLQLADRSRLLCANLAAEYPEMALETALRSSADTFHVLHLHRVGPLRLRWVFEKAVLHSLWRREESVLAVFTVKSFRILDSTALERLFLEFQQRPAVT